MVFDLPYLDDESLRTLPPLEDMRSKKGGVKKRRHEQAGGVLYNLNTGSKTALVAAK
jgi:hypothetical protein